MNIEFLREYILTLEHVEEGFPFGEDVLVFKVNGKMFLLLPLTTVPLRFNAKCDPDYAIELRETYPEAILPGYHMNKKLWNTVIIDGTVPKKLIMEMINDSYRLVKEKSKSKKKLK